MKSLKTISVLALILLVLVSSSNFMIGIHYCSGEVADIGFFADATGCEMERQLPPCHRHLTAPCCENDTIMHQGDDLKLTANQTQLSLPFAIEIASPGIFVSEIIPALHTPQISFQDYDPPLKAEDITVTTQVFRI